MYFLKKNLETQILFGNPLGFSLSFPRFFALSICKDNKISKSNPAVVFLVRRFFT
ncbi:hypothetical protein Cs308_0037 [Candidatus Chlamydia sanziniae]|uniref:Uncharacterized protein n=1 Tax=Candidatus Chlamydia sanziniae TaxID=1806891 RepID=A0A1A9HVT1_9CHLA|nr:hypothetical protein Cs308_0037 [Candidatus Chlamydia sanziniae]